MDECYDAESDGTGQCRSVHRYLDACDVRRGTYRRDTGRGNTEHLYRSPELTGRGDDTCFPDGFVPCFEQCELSRTLYRRRTLCGFQSEYGAIHLSAGLAYFPSAGNHAGSRYDGSDYHHQTWCGEPPDTH